MYCFSASFCFLCLNHHPKADLLDINKNKIKDVKIVDVLQVCGIDSNYCNDSYQVYICEKCVKTLKPFYAFKQKCSKNFLKLKGYVSQMKSNTSVAFHANLRVLLSDPKYGDNLNETIEYMDMSQFLDAQIQMEEMEVQQETSKEVDKPQRIQIDNATNVTPEEINALNGIPEENNAMNGISEENNAMNAIPEEHAMNGIPKMKPLNNEQLYEIGKFIYDNHFLDPPSDSNDAVIEIGSGSEPESSSDVPLNSRGPFNDILNAPNALNAVNAPNALNAVNAPNATKHHCTVCNKLCTSAQQLSIHAFLHTLMTYPKTEASKTMKYYCALCTVDVIGLAKIKKHLLLHTFDKIFTCENCNAEFINYHDLIKHFSLNPTHKPHACKICGKLFISVLKLTTHMQKKHVLRCMFCKSCFKTKIELKVHMKETHNGKHCFICAKSFKTNNELKKHLFDNHFDLQTAGTEGKTQYNCTKCSATFLTKYSLNEHLGVGCNVEEVVLV